MRVLLLSRRLRLLNEVGMMGGLAVVAVSAAAAGVGENLMAVRVPMQMLSGVLRREGRRGNVPHVCARRSPAPADAAALAVPGAAAAAGKVRFVRVVCHRGRWGRHLEKKRDGVARLVKNIHVEVTHLV